MVQDTLPFTIIAVYPDGEKNDSTKTMHLPLDMRILDLQNNLRTALGTFQELYTEWSRHSLIASVQISKITSSMLSSTSLNCSSPTIHLHTVSTLAEDFVFLGNSILDAED